MNPQLYTLEGSTINKIDQANKHEAIEALESGKIIYLPNYSFIPQDNEKVLLSESVLDTKRKNISYNYSKHTLAGVTKQNAFAPLIQQLTHRYAMFSQNLVHTLLPQYKDHLIWGRTSYRPAQIDGRVTSKRKDDTRVHVDAFPSTPVNGLRIFRLFCNINPYGEPRVWHVGESFSQVLNTFSKQLPRYSNTRANLLHFIKATKTKRSAYDHYMLHMHDTMKLNDHYQATYRLPSS